MPGLVSAPDKLFHAPPYKPHNRYDPTYDDRLQTMSDKSESNPPPLPVVLVAAWLMPGLGHWLAGERTRGFIIGISLVLLFVAGLMVGTLHVVNRRSEPLWYAGQILLGPIALAAGETYMQLDPTGLVQPPSPEHPEPPAVFHSIGRVNELGTLYCTLAGVMNLLAILDLIGRPLGRGSEKSPIDSTHPDSLPRGRVATRENAP